MPSATTSPSVRISDGAATATAAANADIFVQKCQLEELELEMEKITSHVEHLKSQNRVLGLALEEAKSTCDSLTELLGKYESNNTALQLSLSYCDSMIESYDVLVALLETSSSSNIAGGRRDNNDNGRHVNRKRAESVARHLLARADKDRRADSGLGVISSSSHLDSTWEDSSGTVDCTMNKCFGGFIG